MTFSRFKVHLQLVGQQLVEGLIDDRHRPFLKAVFVSRNNPNTAGNKIVICHLVFGELTSLPIRNPFMH